MRILQAVSFFSPMRGGGVIAVVYQLSRALAERGHEVTVYTSDFELDRTYVESLGGVTVRPFRSYLSLGGRPLLMPGMIRGAREELRGFDVIHMHECRGFPNIVLRHYARRCGVPYIVDAHGAAARTSRGGVKWLVDGVVGRRILTDATQVIAETELGAKEYLDAGVNDERITILYPPFPVEDYAYVPPPGAFRKTLGIGDEKLILFLGRIASIKGVGFLVEAFHDLAMERDDVLLVIIGSDDGYQATLERRVAELGISGKVILAGYLGGRDKQSALIDAAMLVQPSKYEQGLAWASIEAVLCHTPIIVSKDTGAAEDALRMNAGYLVEYGNRQELKDTMRYILENPREAAVNTQRARGYVMTHLSMEKKVEEYERLYHTVMNRACGQTGAPERGYE